MDSWGKKVGNLSHGEGGVFCNPDYLDALVSLDFKVSASQSVSRIQISDNWFAWRNPKLVQEKILLKLSLHPKYSF